MHTLLSFWSSFGIKLRLKGCLKVLTLDKCLLCLYTHFYQFSDRSRRLSLHPMHRAACQRSIIFHRSFHRLFEQQAIREEPFSGALWTWAAPKVRRRVRREHGETERSGRGSWSPVSPLLARPPKPLDTNAQPEINNLHAVADARPWSETCTAEKARRAGRMKAAPACFMWPVNSS